MNVFLIGFRCSGKSSVGKLLARKIGYKFFDTDKMIEKSTGKTISKIWETEGEPVFRKKEKTVLRTLTGIDRSVVALGGGSVMHTNEILALKKNGIFVWLKILQENVAQRVVADSKSSVMRPRLMAYMSQNKEIQTALKERNPIYKKVSDINVDANNRAIIDVLNEGYVKLKKKKIVLRKEM